ncbi:MAG: tryptophan synthase subunit alpha [Candidatus Levybacteria bacterium]|nr:tryptophan synthase subunit alpha [Candidatus Levybacteria bacterium]
MNKLNQQLEKIKSEKRLGLMTHVVVGYPSLNETVELVRLMEKSGVDIVELQIPFSDPLADGTTIMQACEKSLINGTKVHDAFTIMTKLSREVSIPLLFMAYYNNVFKYGTQKFCKDAKAAGAAGLIVPDIPIEEEQEEHFIRFCKKYNLANIRVISPSSNANRLQKNAKVGSGFVYCTARQGITGARKKLSSKLNAYLSQVKKYFTIPLAVGFGISKPEHIKALKGNADIAVVGSALIDVIDKGDKGDMEKRVYSFIRELNVID